MAKHDVGEILALEPDVDCDVCEHQTMFEKTDIYEENEVYFDCDVAATTRSQQLESVDQTLALPTVCPPPDLDLPISQPEDASSNAHILKQNIIQIPNSMIYGHDSRGRLLLDVTIAGQKCKALIDTGSGVTGISEAFYGNGGFDQKPEALKPFVCRSVTDHTVNTTAHLKNALFQVGGFETHENFALLPISKTYQAILGKDFMRRMGMILDFSASASSIITITGQSVQDAASTEITSILPDWDCDVDIVGNIFDLGAITAGESSGHEFQVVTSKKFKKLKKNQERKAVKEAARAAKLRQQDCHAATLSHSLSITKSVCLAVCLLATAGLGDGCPISSLDYTSTTVEDPQINGVFAQDKTFANINATYIGEPESESTTKRSIFDPFLSCPSYIMEKVNKLRSDCTDVWLKERQCDSIWWCIRFKSV